MRFASQQSQHHPAACQISTCNCWERTCSFFPRWGIFFACMYYFPGGSVVKNPPANAGDSGDMGSILVGRSSGGGNGNPLQYFYLEYPMDRGTWWATLPWGHKESDTTEQLSIHTLYPLKKKPKIFPPVCFHLASLWSLMPAKVINIMKPKWLDGSRLFCHFSRFLSCTSNLRLISTFVYLACEVHNNFPSSVMISDFRLASLTMLHHHS